MPFVSMNPPLDQHKRRINRVNTSSCVVTIRVPDLVGLALGHSAIDKTHCAKKAKLY